MKLVCYGASVTAQKDKGGYFYHLENLAKALNFNQIEKLAFGASHFNYAGFGFAKELIDMEPSVCIIDWLTPSMKEFSEEKIKSLNNALLDIGAIPIWVNFPRTDDLDNKRKCYSQVKSICEQHNIEFWDLSIEISDFKQNPEQYLRDVVHTNKFGATAYAEVLTDKLKKLNFESVRNNLKKPYSSIGCLPSVIELNEIINRSNSLTIDFEVEETKTLEVILGSVIGPKVCYFQAELINDNEVVSSLVNPADPWCYYERSMMIAPITFDVAPGRYSLKFSYCAGNPLDSIELRQPLSSDEQFDEQKRMLSLSSMSINAKPL